MNTEAAALAWAESLAPVTEEILDLARPMPGERVLDIGAGAGHLSIDLAARVGPSGLVLAVDPSADAVAAIERRAADSQGRAPVRAMQATAESLEVGDTRFDLAVARNSVMYFDDLRGGLAAVRRALRAGGRFVASVYGPLADDPFHAIPLAVVRRRTSLMRPLPEYAAAFELGADEFESALAASGWHVVSRREVPVRRTFASLDELKAALRGSRSLAELLVRLADAGQAEAWREIDAGFGAYSGSSGVVIPGRQVVLAATA